MLVDPKTIDMLHTKAETNLRLHGCERGRAVFFLMLVAATYWLLCRYTETKRDPSQRYPTY